MKVSDAAKMAVKMHEGQTRKWGHASHPYVWHPMRVAGLVSMHPKSTDEMIAASWVHDVVEDCGVPLSAIEEELGAGVAMLVGCLTNPSKGMVLSRAERKAIDRAHLAKAPWEVKLIKLVDRLDNLKEVSDDPETPYDFVKLYRKESMALLEEALMGVDDDLWTEAMSYAE